MTNHVIIRLKNNFRENLEIHRILFLIFQKSMKAIKFFILLKKFLAYLNIFQIYSTQKNVASNIEISFHAFDLFFHVKK